MEIMSGILMAKIITKFMKITLMLGQDKLISLKHGEKQNALSPSEQFFFKSQKTFLEQHPWRTASNT